MVDKDVDKNCRKCEQNLMSRFRDIYQQSVAFGGKNGYFWVKSVLKYEKWLISRCCSSETSFQTPQFYVFSEESYGLYIHIQILNKKLCPVFSVETFRRLFLPK